MPFDIAKETGTWKASGNSDNYGEILQKLGVPPDMLPKVLEIEYSVEMSVSGDTFTYKITEFGQTSVNTFTLGVESEEKDAWGTTRMVTYSMEGDSLVNTYPSVDGKGLKFSSARRFLDDNTIHTELKVGDLVGWSEAKRVV
ncbi:fatty acid-binding protein, liver-like [Branchiostoma floridae x Branchiostoma japonicum]